MKGLVFREFVDMVESQYSPHLLESLLAQVRPASGGAYTTVGTYDHQELVALVQALSNATQTPVDRVLQAFGWYLSAGFLRKFGHFFAAAPDLFAFLESIETHIHREVLKLYPDAQLPHFTHARGEDGSLHMVYRSSRSLEHMALGLIEGCARHFGEDIRVAMDTATDAQGKHTRFHICRRGSRP